MNARHEGEGRECIATARRAATARTPMRDADARWRDRAIAFTAPRSPSVPPGCRLGVGASASRGCPAYRALRIIITVLMKRSDLVLTVVLMKRSNFVAFLGKKTRAAGRRPVCSSETNALRRGSLTVLWWSPREVRRLAGASAPVMGFLPPMRSHSLSHAELVPMQTVTTDLRGRTA